MYIRFVADTLTLNSIMSAPRLLTLTQMHLAGDRRTGQSLGVDVLLEQDEQLHREDRHGAENFGGDGAAGSALAWCWKILFIYRRAVLFIVLSVFFFSVHGYSSISFGCTHCFLSGYEVFNTALCHSQ